MLIGIADNIKAKTSKKYKTTVKVRIEGVSLRIYTTDLNQTLGLMRAGDRKKITQIGVMDPQIKDHIVNTPKETYRTIDRVVRKLPYENQKFKVFYVNASAIKRSIGFESLQGILFQLKQYPSVRWTADMDELIVCDGVWKETFFYCTDLDWLPVVTLIDSRFIKRIERLTTEEEVVTV